MAILRGVESGFSIARAAKQGRLTVSDSRGRVFAWQSSAAPAGQRHGPVFHPHCQCSGMAPADVLRRNGKLVRMA